MFWNGFSRNLSVRMRVIGILCIVANGAGAEPSDISYTKGRPWTGERGVAERTDHIMQRGKRLGREYRVHKVGRIEMVEYEESATNAAPFTSEAQVAAVAGPTAQTVGTTFLGATLNDTHAYPPDSMGAVGPEQFIVAVNGRVRSFNKNTGTADGVIDADTDDFFASVMTPPATNNFTSDPRIRYDRLSKRWFVIMLDVPNKTGTDPNRIMLAVSDGPVISGSSVWTFYYFQHDLVSPAGDAGEFADYPTLGIDANALYIGVNVFATSGLGSFDNTTAFVVRKSSLLSGGPIVVTAFRNLVDNSPQKSGAYTPQGVDNFDPNASEGYIIGVSRHYYGQLKLRRISDPGGTPSISDNITISMPTINGNTIKVPHLGNTGGSAGELDGLDYRVLAAHYRDGSLWTTENMAVNNVGAANGTDTRMGVRWYEIGGIASGETPSVVQSGTLFQSSASNASTNRCYWMGTAMVSGQGHVAMGFSVAGSGEYINAGTVGRLKNDPAGTMRTPVLYTTSTTPYNPTLGGSPVDRWGDYSYTSLDPDDDMTMWTIQEWCNTTNSYGVQVAKLLAPPPATPFSCNPVSLNPGSTNVNVTLFGSTDGNTGFFDPGPGFSNRIAAVVGGSGVAVNSITYNNPTNLTLNLSVLNDATTGVRTITVINPDGQSVQSVGGILTIEGISVDTNHPPELPAIADKSIVEGNLLSFTNVATDVDDDSLTYSLLNAPTGTSVSSNGVFGWVPDESQGPSSNTIAMVVTDSGVPSLSATQTFSVVVYESNIAPIMTVISGKTVTEGNALTFTNIATDADIPANALTYSLLGMPAGASVSSNGVFSWTPDESQGPSSNQLTLVVTDNGIPNLSATQTFSVVVYETNAAPVLSAVADRTIHATFALSIASYSTDGDIPTNTLTYSLDPGAPATSDINPSSGLFAWTPTMADVGTTNSIAVRVTDNGVPPLSDTQSFTIIVVDRPIIVDMTISNDVPTLEWTSIPGQTYQMQYKPLLTDPDWTSVTGDVTAASATASKTDPDETASNRFYRVEVVP